LRSRPNLDRSPFLCDMGSLSPLIHTTKQSATASSQPLYKTAQPASVPRHILKHIHRSTAHFAASLESSTPLWRPFAQPMKNEGQASPRILAKYRSSAQPAGFPGPVKESCFRMNSIDIGFVVYQTLISIWAVLRLRKLQKARKYDAGYRLQRMCRSCGSITPRVETHCVQCGKPFPIV
jgi:hypothetical protein